MIESPCISICVVDENNVCSGCYRSLNEIAQWSASSDAEKQVILVAAKKREKAELEC